MSKENEAKKVLAEAEAQENEDTMQEDTAPVPAPVVAPEEKKPGFFKKVWNGAKEHKGAILGTIGAIGAGIVGFVLGAACGRSEEDDRYSDDDYYSGDDSSNATPFYGGSDDDQAEDFSNDSEEIS